MKPLGKVKIEWSPEFAYAIGLIVTDGCLSGSKIINLTSKDKEQIQKFLYCLQVSYKIGRKSSGSEGKKKYFVVQIGDVLFCRFLNSIGITPHKSKTIGVVKLPDLYFYDFLRGHFDGDGTFYSYWDPRWRSSFVFYTEFISASKTHIDWIRSELFNRLKISGHISKSVNSSVYQLKFAKAESLKLLPRLYYNPEVVCLSRKRIKIEDALAVNDRHL
jgi:hypothetical protein